MSKFEDVEFDFGGQGAVKGVKVTFVLQGEFYRVDYYPSKPYGTAWHFEQVQKTSKNGKRFWQGLPNRARLIRRQVVAAAKAHLKQSYIWKVA